MLQNRKTGHRHLQLALLTWILLSLSFSGCLCDLCKQLPILKTGDIGKYIHKTAVPRGQMQAGVYEQDTAANSSAECVLSCCDNSLCNVALYTQRQCFNIECENEVACQPVEQKGVKFNDTLMVQVRTIEETSTADECSFTQPECKENETCKLVEGAVTRCVCEEGYQRPSPYSKQCVQVTTVDVPVSPSPTPDIVTWKSCEYGLHECDTNEECAIKNTRAKYGTCRCVSGYIANISGKCIQANKEGKSELTNEEGKSVVEEETVMPRTNEKVSTDSPPASTKLQIVTTTATPTTSTPKVEMLTVSAGDSKVIQLPVNTVTLTAFVLKDDNPNNPYQYAWNLLAHPEGAESGSMEGTNTNTLRLSNLIAGLYTFKVQVTATNKFGEAEVNVTVNPPARQNKPPIAVINPDHLNVKSTNTAILDGSDSTDDDKIVGYKWEEISGPLYEKMINGDASILTLKELNPGNYTFKLTVTDSDGATNSTTSNVTVIKEMDYPPKANAGSDVIIHLPQTSVILYGNQSTDDKGIVAYEWTKATNDKEKVAADMQGVRTPELHLSNLEVGDYTFTLKVTDLAGQTSTADVHVFVKPEVNTAPVAVTSGTMEASLPLDNILLDASNSTDDQKITSYLWQQTAGPTILEIRNADQMVATATGDIKVGQYEFKVTVKDKEDLKSSAVLTLNIKQVSNEPPVARAGGDVAVELPQVLVTLDGSRSSDDHKITDFRWVRDPKSLAAGDVLNNSDHQAVLQLVNLVAGRYMFTLTVSDAEGLTSSDEASIIVRKDEKEMDLMELVLAVDIADFTEENKQNLEGQLSLLLPKSPEEGETKIFIQDIQESPSTGNLRVIFYAMNVMRDQKVRRNGVEALKALKRKLLSSDFVLDYKVVSIDTLVCQNNCSAHGHCDLKTKLCICEAFWTHNLFMYKLHGESNCDWSILYVVIICFIIVMTVTGAIWGMLCCWRRRRCRWRFNKQKRRHRYALLQDMDDENDNIQMKKAPLKGKIQNSSVMISESDFSSEEETIFVNQKKSNGHLANLNGVNKQHLKTKMRT